jgi:hypothetical protein
VDASPVGWGAVLTQYNPEKPHEKNIITYISRSLSEIEQRYSQIEKEALAIVWACERLHLYLYASKFEIITDNKAVELIFGNTSSKPKARIERWLLRLLPYEFEISHKPGNENIADYLSRQPCTGLENVLDHEEIAEAYVNMITNSYKKQTKTWNFLTCAKWYWTNQPQQLKWVLSSTHSFMSLPSPKMESY